MGCEKSEIHWGTEYFLKIEWGDQFFLDFHWDDENLCQFLVRPRVASSAIFGAVHYVCNVQIKGTILQNVVRSFLHHRWDVHYLEAPYREIFSLR